MTWRSASLAVGSWDPGICLGKESGNQWGTEQIERGDGSTAI
jgi:hypothetical protein